MKFKKSIAMIMIIAILSSFIALPAVATGSKFKRYIVKDNFDTNLGNWVLGEFVGTDSEATITRVNIDGVSAMALNATKVDAQHRHNYQPTAYLDFEDVEFTAGNKIVIEMKFKQTGNESGTADSYLKYNRPNSQDIKTSYVDANGATQTFTPAAFGENAANWWQMIRMYHNKIASDSGNNIAADTVNNWTEVKIVIDEGTKKYSVTTKTGDVQFIDENIPFTGSIWEMQCFDGSKTDYDSLDSLTLFIRGYANTVYVDYFNVYEEIDFVTVSQATLENNYIRTTDALNLTFNTDSNISVLPDGAVYIDGVESIVTYDSTTKTVKLQPKAELAPGAQHVVKINTSVLEEQIGVKFTGETEYPFSVSDVSVGNLVATGRVIPGTVITTSYVYNSTKPEGTHLYQWQESLTDEDGSFTDITGATTKDFAVTENEYGKYLRLKMIPYGLDEEGNNTYYGFETYSNIVIPEKKPVASNVKMSTDVVFTGTYLTANYDFSDENGDNEGETVIKWYASDSLSGEWTEVYDGPIYYVDDTVNGKYIKLEVTPVAVSVKESVGTAVSSVVAGPVADILASTNLFTDSGFETGVLGDWKYSVYSGSEWKGVKIQNKDAYEGEYALELTSRHSIHESFGQDLDVQGGRTYVLGVWATKTNKKVEDITGFTPYIFDGQIDRGEAAEKYSYTLKNEWQLMAGSFIAREDHNARFGITSFTAREKGNENAYLDNFYLGELVIGDIETFEQEDIVIPESGSKEILITSNKVLNQLGTQHGLWDEKVKIEIPETKGISINEKNNIVISSDAIATKITVKLYCKPSYAYAKQSIFQKFIELNIVPHNNHTPRITSIDATGVVQTGETLTGSYIFHQVDGKADNSDKKWMYSDSEDGAYYDIPGATSLTYVVTDAYKDKYIKFVVVPKTEDGITGTEVRSDCVTKPREPVAKNISIEGKFNVGAEVKGKYDYYDVNKDTEGISTYKWYISDSSDGIYTAIPGATSHTLKFTDEMINKYVKFAVTPVSTDAPTGNTEYMSKAYACPATPVAMNVSISKEGNRLIGDYEFYHIHNALETNTIYLWTVDGIAVSNEIDYVINFTGTRNVKFTVTPVADSNPSTGEGSSVAINITGRSDVVGGNTSGGAGGGGSAGGSSGGAGGGGFTSGVTSVNDMLLGSPEEEKKEETKPSDIQGHWGQTYIKEMETRGVMKADEKGNFDPDKTVIRSEMITYLFDALKLEETEYNAEFSDVSSIDSYAGKLQTMINNGTIASYHEFRPNDGISREEMCKILYVSLENAGKLKKPETNVLDVFTDKDLISDWAKDYVNTIYTNKIMIGTSDTTFAPKENITRAQVATMLVRILDVMEKEAE